MKITTIGLDLAKAVFHVVGLNERGKEVTRRKLRRNQVLAYFTKLPPCRIGMEACGGAHHWARKLQGMGHRVDLVPAQHSSGGKDRLLGISKRGDGYVRSLLVQGARSVVLRATGKEDRLSRRINRIRQDRGTNKAVVALANKMARIGWAILRALLRFVWVTGFKVRDLEQDIRDRPRFP